MTRFDPGVQAAGELARLRRLIADDAFAAMVASECNDPDHDDLYCPTCAARFDGIDDYRERLLH
jgi:hypothetical protein